MTDMQSGWVIVVSILSFLAGIGVTAEWSVRAQERAARAGVMVIDGTAYVLVPAKRGVE